MANEDPTRTAPRFPHERAIVMPKRPAGLVAAAKRASDTSQYHVVLRDDDASSRRHFLSLGETLAMVGGCDHAPCFTLEEAEDWADQLMLRYPHEDWTTAHFVSGECWLP